MRGKRTFRILGANLLLAALLVVCIGACGKNEETPESEDTEETVETVVWDEPEEIVEDTIDLSLEGHEGEARSPLTGLWIDEALAKKRPFAVMFGNTTDALPQYGISHADILYEIPVEGGITRLMGIIGDYAQVERLESIRSARLYFVEIATEYDAIYCHVGQAVYAENYLNSAAVSDFNGLKGSFASVFFRDSTRKAPHNCYVTGESIVNGIASNGFRDEYEDGFDAHFTFANAGDDVNEGGAPAEVIVTGYRLSNTRFVYDEERDAYLRWHYKREHIDGTTGEQLAFTNVILMSMNGTVIDNNGYMRFDTVGSGTGRYYTGGKGVDVTWNKDSLTTHSVFYDAAGGVLNLAPGKTAICVIDSDEWGRTAEYETIASYEGSSNG